MNLKHILSIGVALLAFNKSNAQIQLGPELGFTYSTLNVTHNDKDYNHKYVGGVTVGATADIPIDGNFYFQPSIQAGFLQGGKADYMEYYRLENGIPGSTQDEREYRIYSVQIPLLFTVKTDFKYHPNNLTFSVGPKIGLNYAGHYERRSTTTMNGIHRPVVESRDMYIGNNAVEHDIRLFEISAMAQVGYEMLNGFNVKLGYYYSFNNIAPNTKMDKIINHGAQLSLSYYFLKRLKY